MTRLYLVRHGDTAANSRERYWGCSDVELSALGLEQAEKLSRRLGQEKIDAVYSSELQRALITARTIAVPHQLEVQTCPELRETNFGKIEGLNFEEISRLYPDLTKLWVNWDPELRFPEGEAVKEAYARVAKFPDRLKQHGRDGSVLVVAHAGTLRLLICNLLGLNMKHWRQVRVDMASLSILETYPQGAILIRLNDVSHLA